ncbi:MAG TPA: hypothetical protein VJB14_13295 [Planctomycetota bacterium]|nr:hypothetical protein [Planctomycetota bacterium]
MTFRTLALLVLAAPTLAAQQKPTLSSPKNEPVGVVCHVKVTSDKVPDMTNLETWKKAYIKEGMTDEQKAMVVWKTVRTFQHQDSPPVEHLQNEEVAQDPIKVYNVYGYAFCSVASCGVEALSRYVGLQARGRIINSHSVPEVYYDGAWHLLDSSLMCYFPKADGKAAGVDEIMAGVKEWYDKNPGYKKNEKKLYEFMRNGGWRKGPEVLSRCPNYDENGWFEAATHGWYSTMQEYDGSANGIYEYGYSQGYQVNIQLRPGERLTRNWSNKGLHVNMQGGGEPGCMKMQTGKDSLRYTPKDGDLAPGRVGNGTLEYDVPQALLKEAAKTGSFTVRMPSSYVYLSGKATFKAAGPGPVTASLSDNNGLDWKDVPVAGSEIDLTPHVFRRYDYRLNLKGALDSLRITHDIQHSQRPLPALDKGTNTLTFSAGPAEGTITVEGNTDASKKGKQLVYTDFHPTHSGLENGLWVGGSGKGEVIFPVATPGEMVRLRFGAHYRARDAKDGIDYAVSFDGGKSWRAAGRAAGPTPGNCTYVTFAEVPPGTKEALVRYSGTSRNATGIHNFRIDADFKEPRGGFRPVKVTYTWEEDGKAKQDVHVAKKPDETYTIPCQAKPVMKSIVLELAE